MKASFFEYHVAMSGIFTAKANLNVVGQNMANAAIPGYSRQVTIQQASRPLSLFDGKGMYGTGSEVLGIKQIRDKYLDNKFWQHSNVFGEYQAKNANLEMIETVFNDIPDSGVLACFKDYFETLQDLSTSPESPTYRSNVINAAQTLTDMVQTNAQALQKQQRDINSEVENAVAIINSLGAQIADVSKQIRDYEMDGSMANDLRDQRGRLVDQLSEFVNVKVEEVDYSNKEKPHDIRFTVLIDGQVFVQNNRSNPLKTVARQAGDKKNEMDIAGLFDIEFANTGASFNIYSVTLKGTLKGLIDVRDGNGNNITAPDPKNGTEVPYKGIPFYMNELNVLVRTFARSMNEGLDFKMGTIPQSTTGNVVGHMYGYNLNDVNDENFARSLRLLFTADDGNKNYFGGGMITGGTVPPGSVTMWKCTYTTPDGVIHNEMLTSKETDGSDLLDDLPAGTTLNSNTQMSVWERVYKITKDGKEVTVRDVELAPSSPGGTGPAPPNGATSISGYPKEISNTSVDYDTFTALNFSVNPDITESGGSFLLACASDPSLGESANDVILGFSKIGEYNSLFREGKLLDFVIGTAGHLAVDRQQAQKFEENYTEIKMMTDSQRMSVSGVSTDEEIVNMVRYNQQFTACAKLVNVINDIYDTLINRLGV